MLCIHARDYLSFSSIQCPTFASSIINPYGGVNREKFGEANLIVQVYISSFYQLKRKHKGTRGKWGIYNGKSILRGERQKQKTTMKGYRSCCLEGNKKDTIQAG